MTSMSSSAFLPQTLLLACTLAIVGTSSVGCRKPPPKKEARVRIISTARHHHLRPLPVASSPSLDKLIAASSPLRLHTRPVAVHDEHIEVTRCSLQGPPLLHRSIVTAVRGIAVHDGQMLLIGPHGGIHAYQLTSTDKTCTAQPDLSFGNNGTWTPPRPLRSIVHDARGLRIASDGFLGCYSARAGNTFAPCPWHDGGFVALSSDGDWGIRYFSNTDVTLLSLGQSSWKSRPWALAHLNDNNKRRGPMINVTAVTIDEPRVLVGGVLAEQKGQRKSRQAGVVVFDKQGHELLTFKAPETKPPLFGWVHAISACGKATCVLDASRGMLTLWNKKGVLLGKITWSETLGLSHPWTASMDFDPATNALFVTASQMRGPNGRIAEGTVVRLTSKWDSFQ